MRSSVLITGMAVAGSLMAFGFTPYSPLRVTIFGILAIGVVLMTGVLYDKLGGW